MLKANRNIAALIQEGKALLLAAGKENARKEAELLLMAATGLTKIQILTEDQREIENEAAQAYAAFLNERAKGRPLQYILGEWEFMGLPFLVGEGVLIPRADTEILVEAVLEKHGQYTFQNGVDIGTGSGCIPISLEHWGALRMTAVDISEKALGYARANNEKNHTTVQFLQSDLLFAIQEDTQFDFIVSNPPYITKAELPQLMTEVRAYEPMSALDGGVDGLDFYRRILTECIGYLKNGGWVFFEMGCMQGAALMQLMAEHGLQHLELRQDLAGLDRVVLGQKKE